MKKAPSILDQARRMADHYDRIAQLKPLLEKLYWHHRSQARGAPRTSAAYHKELAAELASFTDLGFSTSR